MQLVKTSSGAFGSILLELSLQRSFTLTVTVGKIDCVTNRGHILIMRSQKMFGGEKVVDVKRQTRYDYLEG